MIGSGKMTGQAPLFISHASLDGAEAARLVTLLEQAGQACWVAPRDIRPGYSYPGEILRGIQGCGAMVVLLSAHANQSPHVAKEVELANRDGKPVLPLRIQAVEPTSDLRYWLSAAHWIDGFELDDAELVRALLSSCAGMLIPPRPRRRRRPLAALGAGLGLAALALAGFLFWPASRPAPVPAPVVPAGGDFTARCLDLHGRIADDFSASPVRLSLLGRTAIQGLQDCASAVGQAPDDPVLAGLHGWTLGAMGRFDDARGEFARAAAAGDGLGLYGLGILTLFGLAGFQADEAAARPLLEQARSTVPQAATRLAWMIARGMAGFEPSDIEARRLFQAAADQGNANAQVNLALMYQHGLAGLPKAPDKAARLLRAAADQDYEFAVRQLAALCTSPDGAGIETPCAGYR